MALLPKQFQKLTPSKANMRVNKDNWVAINNGFTIGPGWSWSLNAIIAHVHNVLQRKGVTGRHLDRWRPIDSARGQEVVYSDGYVFNQDIQVNELYEILKLDRSLRDVRLVNKTGYATSVKN